MEKIHLKWLDHSIGIISTFLFTVRINYHERSNYILPAFAKSTQYLGNLYVWRLQAICSLLTLSNVEVLFTSILGTIINLALHCSNVAFEIEELIPFEVFKIYLKYLVHCTLILVIWSFQFKRNLDLLCPVI